jgi:hypothetical protein
LIIKIKKIKIYRQQIKLKNSKIKEQEKEKEEEEEKERSLFLLNHKIKKQKDCYRNSKINLKFIPNNLKIKTITKINTKISPKLITKII